jgi:hypothetical protein
MVPDSMKSVYWRFRDSPTDQRTCRILTPAHFGKSIARKHARQADRCGRPSNLGDAE